MELQEIKNFIRVDFDEDDSLILLIMEVAAEYIKEAVGRFDEKSARARLLFLTLVTSMYENRQYTVDKADEKLAYITHSIILQLQLEGEAHE